MTLLATVFWLEGISRWMRARIGVEWRVFPISSLVLGGIVVITGVVLAKADPVKRVWYLVGAGLAVVTSAIPILYLVRQ
jgi:hypothetical protein